MLDGYEKLADAFRDQGAGIIAASADPKDKAAEIARNLSFPVCYGVTRDQGDRIGAWWEEKRDHIQPSEFLLTRKGRVLSSTYSSSPLGRMDPEETLSLVKMLAKRNNQG